MLFPQPVGVVAGVLQQELQVSLGQVSKPNHVAHVSSFTLFKQFFLFRSSSPTCLLITGPPFPLPSPFSISSAAPLPPPRPELPRIAGSGNSVTQFLSFPLHFPVKQVVRKTPSQMDVAPWCFNFNINFNPKFKSIGLDVWDGVLWVEV